MSWQRPTVVAVFGASAAAPGDGRYEAGVQCGRLLAEAGLSVATGGYGGLMEAVSQGAAAAGGHVVGVTAPGVFPSRSGANPFVAEERAADSLTERIHELTSIAAAVIVLPGSLGTAAELMVAWNLAFVAPFSGAAPFPVVTVGSRWRRIVGTLASELDADDSLVQCVDSVDEAAAAVIRSVPR
jgi:hypothetical protein